MIFKFSVFAWQTLLIADPSVTVQAVYVLKAKHLQLFLSNELKVLFLMHSDRKDNILRYLVVQIRTDHEQNSFLHIRCNIKNNCVKLQSYKSLQMVASSSGVKRRNKSWDEPDQLNVIDISLEIVVLAVLRFKSWRVEELSVHGRVFIQVLHGPVSLKHLLLYPSWISNHSYCLTS